jgi:hypothetical protein
MKMSFCLGLWTLPIIRKYKRLKNITFLILDLFPSSGEGRETPFLTLERANLGHWMNRLGLPELLGILWIILPLVVSAFQVWFVWISHVSVHIHAPPYSFSRIWSRPNDVCGKCSSSLSGFLQSPVSSPPLFRAKYFLDCPVSRHPHSVAFHFAHSCPTAGKWVITLRT